MATNARTATRKAKARTPRKVIGRTDDQPQITAAPPAPCPSPWERAWGRLGRDPRLAARRTVLAFALAMLAFSVAPVVNNLRGLQNKDYDLWYATGRAYLRGDRIYPTDHRPFPFMYPPSCGADARPGEPRGPDGVGRGAARG